jgi:hypothetical protein
MATCAARRRHVPESSACSDNDAGGDCSQCAYRSHFVSGKLMLADRRNAWGFSLFGDDIRAELGGKASLMGLYQTDYLFQGTYPFAVSKFVIFIMYYELVEKMTSDITFKIHLPGDGPERPILEFPILRKDLPIGDPKNQPEADDEEEVERISHARIPIILSPLVIPAEGFVKVRAHFNDGSVLRLGRLRMRAIGPEEAAALGVGSEQTVKPPG